MTDPVFLIAITGLGLSGLVSAIRLIDWFLHTDPKAIAQTGRWAAIGLFALSLPLLLGLVVEHKWTAAIGLSAVLLFAFALYGPRYLSRLSLRRLKLDLSMPSAGYSGANAATADDETVHRAIAVLEDYLRHAGSNSKFESNGTHLQADRSAVPRARGQRGGNGHDDVHGALPMPDAEALQVLGLGAGATESEINESHRRLMQLIHPDRGGSAYFAVKVNQAKDVLLGRGQSLQDRGASAGTRKRRRAASQQDFSQSKPTTGGSAMSRADRKAGRKPTVKDRSVPPQIELEEAQNRGALASAQQIDAYLQRKSEVAQDDHQAFKDYLSQKAQVAPPAKDELKDEPPPPSKFNRRNLLKVVAGTAVAGEAAAAGYAWMTSGSASDQGAQIAGSRYAEAQRHNIERTLIDTKSDVGGRGLGKWVALLPTKLGGGTYALDLNTNRVLASIWYWTYGDYNPISHHLCAFPSADPYHSFEFVNSTQGGKNCLIYGINTRMSEPGPGFNIYRVRYDGAQMELMENVSETTGLGLGVHVTINPKDAQSYFVTDGQKDIAACFDRTSSRVIAALKFDWQGNSTDLRECWKQGGTLKIAKIYPDLSTGKFDYRGTKGQKIEWEMVPMGELFVEEGTIPGSSPHTLTGADGTIWHPSGRWAATVVRLCGGIAILDAENNFNPVAFLQFNKDSQDQYPVTRIDNDHWQVVFDKIASPGHEIGFSPDGRFLCMMNNLRENNCSIFDSSDPDPTKWRKVAHVEDPLWGGKYPNPFHMVFSLDGSKLYLSVLHPSPAASGVMVVDTTTWKIKKEIQGIGPDLQTPAITYDGKYVLVPFSGFQRLSSGIAVIDAEKDELLGILPSTGGHHDCVIIPTEIGHMKHTRSCTL